MKKRFIVLILSLLVVGYFVNVPSVNAFTPANLAVTHGQSGAWDTGGYDFNGTAYATKAGFKPLDGLPAFTMIVWVRMDNLTLQQIFCGQRDNSLNQARLYFWEGGITGQVADGGNVVTQHTGDVSFNINGLQMIAFTWDKDDDSGKLTVWVNTTEYKSATGVTGAVSADDEFVVGADHILAFRMNGSMFSLRLFEDKLSAGSIASYYAMGPDYTDPILWHYWDMNDASGNVMFGYSASWRFTKEVNFTLDMPNWSFAHNVIFEVMVPVFEGGINVLVSLAGLALIPVSTGYLAKGGSSELSLKKLEVFFLLFFIGWAMFLGGILT